MLNRKTIIVDIDGTLANLDHRLHHLQPAGVDDGAKDVADPAGSRKIDWDAFHAECEDDEPIVPTCNLVRELADADWCVILITGRGGEQREKTERWLYDHDIPYDLMLMRRPGDHSPDVDVKFSWLQMLIDGRISTPGMNVPSVVIEDRARTVEMWRRQGLVALQCDEGDF